jgi:hypothetical protein
MVYGTDQLMSNDFPQTGELTQTAMCWNVMSALLRNRTR